MSGGLHRTGGDLNGKGRNTLHEAGTGADKSALSRMTAADFKKTEGALFARCGDPPAHAAIFGSPENQRAGSEAGGCSTKSVLGGEKRASNERTNGDSSLLGPSAMLALLSTRST